MFLIFIVSALSIHSFLVHNDPFYIFAEHENQKNVDILPVQDNQDKKIIKVKTISNLEGDESLDSDMNEENNSDSSEISLENSDVLENSELGDEYEEIVFEDNFDKEYWEWTEDNYLEE